MWKENRKLTKHLLTVAEQLCDAYTDSLISEEVFLRTMRELKCLKYALTLKAKKHGAAAG